MPRIPRFNQTTSIPGTTGGVPMSPQLASAPERALIGFGQEVQRTGQIIGDIVEKEQAAHDTIEAMKIETQLETRKQNILEKFSKRTDYDNFDADLEKELADLQATSMPKKMSPRLNVAYQRSFNGVALDLKGTIRTKKLDVMGKQGEIALDELQEQDLKKWINATPEERAAIEKNFAAKGDAAIATFAVNPLVVRRKVEEFRAKAQVRAIDEAVVSVLQTIDANPKTARSALDDPTYNPDIPIIKRQELKNKADAKIISDEKEETARIEKETKEIITKNDIQARADFHNGKLTWPELQERAKTPVVSKRISEATFNTIEALMRTGADVKNNPVVVGDLAFKVGMGVDVRPELRTALNRGRINDSTYISLTQNLGTKLMSEGQKILNQALAPSQLDRWSPDKNLKHSDATVEYNNLVASGMSPPDAANKVIGSYTAHIRRTLNGLAKPTYLSGDKTNMVDLDKAEERTVAEYNSKRLTEAAYKIEMQKIEDLRRLNQDNQKMLDSEKEIDNLKKQVKR